jgi:predicted methyltransferase
MRSALAVLALLTTPLALGADRALNAAIAGEWRSDDARARDTERHPAAALEFWGLEPGMSILEIQPGEEAWWTEILAPYAHMTGGEFHATAPDLEDPGLDARARDARSAFAARFAAQPAVYGEVELVNWGRNSRPLPENEFDFILTARSVHGWMRQGYVDKAFKEFYSALKPGGILALEQHRAAPGKQDPEARSGYVTEQYVIDQARKAGFELGGKSEINANPADTRDHPFGVWTLPPARRTSAFGDPPDPSFDRSRYDAIGESDRMTLKFVKPR